MTLGAAQRRSIQAYHLCTDGSPSRSPIWPTNASAERKWTSATSQLPPPVSAPFPERLLDDLQLRERLGRTPQPGQRDHAHRRWMFKHIAETALSQGGRKALPDGLHRVAHASGVVDE